MIVITGIGHILPNRSTNSTLVEPVRDRADAALATVQAALDPTLFGEAFDAGQQMSLEDAFSTVLVPSKP